MIKREIYIYTIELIMRAIAKVYVVCRATNGLITDVKNGAFLLEIIPTIVSLFLIASVDLIESYTAFGLEFH